MKSIFAKLTLWFFATLVVSLAAFVTTNIWFTPRPADPRRMFSATERLQLEGAADAWRRGGAAELKKYVDRLDELFPGRHYFLDEFGRDVLTGEDRSEAVQAARSHHSNLHVRSEGRFTLLINAPVRPDPLSFLPYYLWIALLVALMSWVFARHLAAPLRQLREVVRRFGAGDLSLRTQSRRRDELGDLARDFDTMADRLETLLTAERRLLQDISHELRTPLSRLSLAVELARTSPDPASAHARIKKEVARMSALIGELTEMTRAEGDPASQPREDVDLSTLLTSLAADFELGASVEPGLRIQGRSTLIRRAVENVLTNALRYSPDGVSLKAFPEAGEAHIVVRDHGPGVPEEMLGEIFRPFVRVEADRSRDSGGVGLGLAIAQRAVLLHSGKMVARNASPGLEVEIRLPL